MSQAKGCKWYRKGKLRDLGIHDSIYEDVELEPFVGEEQNADEENGHNGDQWDPQEVMEELHDELFDLISIHPPSDPVPSPNTEDLSGQEPQSLAGPSRRMLDHDNDQRVVIEHPTAGRVV